MTIPIKEIYQYLDKKFVPKLDRNERAKMATAMLKQMCNDEGCIAPKWEKSKYCFNHHEFEK